MNLTRIRGVFAAAVGLTVGLWATNSAAQGTPPADADSAQAAARKPIDSDGTVTVFEEAFPGEGIEGFYWTFDKQAELKRLLDKELRAALLDRIEDAYGFPLVIPDSIRALRDSVRAVADSILAVTIDLGSGFDPRYKSTYSERKDDFSLTHDFDTSYLLSRAASLSFTVADQNDFNESTRRRQDNRTVTSGTTFKFVENLSSSLTLSRTDLQSVRASVEEGGSDVLENKSDNTSISLKAQGRRVKNYLAGFLLGDLDLGVGLSAGRRNYTTTVAEGKNNQLSPNWSLRGSRAHSTGSVSFDYTGDMARARSEETRTTSDSTITVAAPTRDRNFTNSASGTWEQDLATETDLKVTGGISRNRFQYLSQAQNFLGQQETREQLGNRANATFNTKTLGSMTLKLVADFDQSETKYTLERDRFARTTQRSADSELNYNPWAGGRLVTKFTRTWEDRDYLTVQKGQVNGRKASFDFEQKITSTISTNFGYFGNLDSYLFDAFDENQGDRDIVTERTTVKVRYAPPGAFNGALNMENRQTSGVNIHPERSQDNKTDETFLIQPTYSLKLGRANISGEFSLDAAYSVFDFKESSNFLLRRFSTRQKWQHSFTTAFSTEFVWTYDIGDEGSYVRNVSGIRLYSRARETHKHKESLELRYAPRGWLRTSVIYRQDADDQYTIGTGGTKTLTSTRDLYELTLGAAFKRRLTEHVELDVDYSQTQKAGARIAEVERRYYTIRASIEYRPFGKKEKKGEGTGDENGGDE